MSIKIGIPVEVISEGVYSLADDDGRAWQLATATDLQADPQAFEAALAELDR
jgi:hypothetical protein